jgi:predicted RNase H-like nuclease (RuvC/YqgF family)
MEDKHVMLFRKTEKDKKIEQLEADLASKDAEIASLSQKFADLETVVDIMLNGGETV